MHRSLWIACAVLFGIGVLGASRYSLGALPHCGDFSRYGDVSDTEIDNNQWLKPDEKRVGKVDKHIKRFELEEAYACILDQSKKEISDFFQSGSYVVDPDFYQFAFSDFAYGSVLLDNSSYQAYLAGEMKEGMQILKITFDFDGNLLAAREDVFAARVVNGAVVYSEFLGDRFVETDRCLECHDTRDRGGLFFKSRFTGYKFTRTADRN